MKIAYLIPTHMLTGGVKAMLQQIKELNNRGHIVNIYYRLSENQKSENESALPAWSHLTQSDVSSQVIVPAGKPFADYLNNEDIIIPGFANQIEELGDSEIPVVLWEQGYQAIYGEFGKLLSSNSYERYIMHKFYRVPVNLLAVSFTLKEILRNVYNREAQLFPNGIDTNFYYPSEKKNNEIPIVLLVGAPGAEFKGAKFAIKVLEGVARKGILFKVWWASQNEVSVENAPFDIEIFFQPPQEKLAELYRNADIYLSTSLYESFPLPPIEAMASGTAVIATDSGGIKTYAEQGENCLLCDQGDEQSMIFALSNLLLDTKARDFLAKAGRETALKYSFNNIVPILEECLLKIIAKSK